MSKTPAELAELALTLHRAAAFNDDPNISGSDSPVYRATRATLRVMILTAYPDLDAGEVYNVADDSGEDIAYAAAYIRRNRLEEAAECAREEAADLDQLVPAPPVWVAVQRRGVDHHAIRDEHTTMCGRSTRSGVVLSSAPEDSRLCARCVGALEAATTEPPRAPAPAPKALYDLPIFGRMWAADALELER